MFPFCPHVAKIVSVRHRSFDLLVFVLKERWDAPGALLKGRILTWGKTSASARTIATKFMKRRSGEPSPSLQTRDLFVVS